MRRKRDEEQKIKDKVEKQVIGERYDRTKLQQVTSPSFLQEDKVPRWKK